MNYLANKVKHLLRKLWPFVTLRQAHGMADVIKELAEGVDDEVHTLVRANNLVCNRLDKLEVEAAKLKTALDYITSNVYRRDEPKKKPSRKKPAKKRGGAKA